VSTPVKQLRLDLRTNKKYLVTGNSAPGLLCLKFKWLEAVLDVLIRMEIDSKYGLTLVFYSLDSALPSTYYSPLMETNLSHRS